MRLSVRAEQKSVIEAVTQENFVRRIALHLLNEYSESVVILPSSEKFTVDELPKDKLYDLVRMGIERARRYEMTFESSISTFTVLTFAVSPNFDTHNLFQVILNDDAVEPDNRLDEVSNIFSEKNWNSIREKYDPSAWNQEKNTDEINEIQAKDENQANPIEPKIEDFDEQDLDFDEQDLEKTIKTPVK